MFVVVVIIIIILAAYAMEDVLNVGYTYISGIEEISPA
jgi:hypothetical protein